MASIEEVIKDPDFLKLSGPDQVAILDHLNLKPQGERLIQEPNPRSGYQSFQNIPETQPEKRGGAMPFVNRNIAATLGAPADFISKAVPGSEPPLGRKFIERGMKSIGIELPTEGQAPETIPEHMGTVVGQATALMNPVARGVKALSQGTNLTAKVAKIVWDSMVKHPYLTMTSELTSAGGAGSLRGVGEQEFPDSPLIKSSLEVAGGLVGGLSPTLAINAPTLVGIRAGRNVLRRLTVPFTKKGSEYRAGKHLRGKVGSPDAVANEVSGGDLGDLPPAVASGEQKIVELYKGLVGLDPVADAKMIQRTTRSIIDLESKMRKLGYGSPELLAEITERRIAALELGMDKRVLDASTKAQERLNKLPVAQRKAAESRIVEQELRKAMLEHRASNTKLWADVNKDFETGFENTRATYESLVADLGEAQIVDVPASLKSSSIINNKKLKSTTLREMQSLRSKLKETSRNARKEGQWNKARISDDMADAILEDLKVASKKGSFITREEAVRLTGEATEDAADMVGKSGIRSAAIRLKPHEGYPNGRTFTGENHGVAMQAFDDAGYGTGDWAKLVDDADGFMINSSESATLEAAIADTVKFKNRFESGETGRLLGYSKSGAPAINPDLALEMTIGRMGERGAVDISKIVASPEAKAATQRYLGRSFTDYAAPQGTVSPVKADRWMKTNEAILDEYPELRNQLSDSTTAQQLADDTRIRMDARKQKLRDPKISTSANFLNRVNLGTEIDGIFNARHSSKMAHELVLQAKKDPSGEALEGLRAGFVEHILDSGRKGSFNQFGEQTMSGSTVLGMIKRNESTLRMVFDNNQISRMKRIGTALSKLETLSNAKGNSKIELEDWASKTIETVARLIGADIGPSLGGSSLGGGMQKATIVSGKARQLAKYFNLEKAQQLVHDAILSEDPSLLQALLKPIEKPTGSKKDLFVLDKKLNAWLLSTGERVMDRE